ncbi:hypothetical protein BXQ17_10295 [Polaribacter sp. BM10]|nr:hypothetical protein BXQ17_10295 [Polaribacter sp. BM10]
MKVMKILTILTILFGFSQCGSSSIIKNPVFKVEKAFYNNWVGGQKGVAGTKLEIQLENALEIEFDSIYFQNKIAKAEVVVNGNKVQLIGHFSSNVNIKRDVILDSNPTKELENTLPTVKKFPFQLEKNEAIISFNKDGKSVFYKVKNIKEVQSRAFPMAQKNN